MVTPIRRRRITCMVQRTKPRNFTAKENVGATSFAIGSVNATNLEAPLAGDIAELIIFK